MVPPTTRQAASSQKTNARPAGDQPPRSQHLARVRLEGEHGKRRAEAAGDARALLDDRTVAQMDPVEIADGDDRALRVRGRGLPVPNDAHGRAFPESKRPENRRSPLP